MSTQTKIRYVIADDEPLARERLKRLLTEVPTFELAAECAHGIEALNSIRSLKPDLVFLDVQMPELDGFGVLAELASEERPAIIFTTAYDKFAVHAFEVHAVDYLLKPFDRERLLSAVERARELLRKPVVSQTQHRLDNLLDEVRPRRDANDRISIKTGGKIVLVKPEDIDWIEAADNYVSLHIGKVTHLLRETMTSMEARLKPSQFVRISRSLIVNVERVKELHPLFHGDYALVLHNGTRLNSSRNYRHKLKESFGV